MSVVANVAINVDAANAIQQLNRVKQASAGVQGGMQAASTGAKGLGAAITAALGPLATITTALAVVQKSLNTTFERAAAEQKLRNFTDSVGEYNAALGLAARASDQFGISQTEATKSLADVYSRLKGLGFGLNETAQIYTGFNAIAMQSGTTAEDAAGAFLQLSQALGSGKLQGDELRSILERMPTLAQTIADSMGRSAAEIREMGQSGEITSEVIYKALSQAAAGADQLGNKLNTQQQAMKALAQVSDQLLNTIGKVFAPAVIVGAQALAQAGQMLSNWWDYIGGVVFPKVYAAIQPVINELQYAFRDLNFDDFRIFLQNVLINGFEVATQVLKGLSTVLAQVINAFRALAENPVFKFIAEQVGRLIEGLGLTTDKVGEFKEEQDKVTQAAAESAKQYSSLPAKIDDAKEKQKELKEEAKRFKEEVNRVKLEYEGLYKAQDEGLSRIENTIKVAEERVKAETAVRDLIKDQLQSQLDQAKTQEQRVEIARRIYDIEIANAKSALAITLQQIDYEIRRAQIVAGTQQLKVQELKTEIAIARARNQTTTELEKALVSQQSAFKIAMQNVEAVEESAKYQKQQAEAIFKSKEFAAKLAFEQNKTAKETAKAATSAHTLADGMERAGAAAEKTAKAANKIAFLGRKTEGTPFAAMGGAGAIEDPALQKQATKIFENAQKFATGKDFRIQQDIFQRARDEIAQLALRDYAARTKVATLTTVPSPAPATFPAPGASEPTVSGLSMQPGGGPGTAVVDRMPSTINLQTGPVLQQDDGSKYVSLGDLEKILQDFATVVFNNARSAGGRRFQGVN